MLLDVDDDFLWIWLVLSLSHFVHTFLLLALLLVSPCFFLLLKKWVIWKVSYIFNSSDYILTVSSNLFLCPCISYRAVVTARACASQTWCLDQKTGAPWLRASSDSGQVVTQGRMAIGSPTESDNSCFQFELLFLGRGRKQKSHAQTPDGWC